MILIQNRRNPVSIGTPQVKDQDEGKLVDTKWRRSTKLISILAILTVCTIFYFLSSHKYPYVNEYENEVISSVNELIHALERVETTRNVILLLPSAEKANRTIGEVNFAAYQEMVKMPEANFLNWRQKFKTRFEARRDEARKHLIKVQALINNNLQEPGPLSYIEENVLAFSVATDAIPPGDKRSAHIFTK
jgi:hypothetical protein